MLAVRAEKGNTDAMAATATANPPAQRTATRLQQLGADALYLLLGLVASIVAFTVWVTAVSVTLSLIILIIGLPLVMLSFAVFRALCDVERKRAALVLGEAIGSSYRPLPPLSTFFQRLRVVSTDPQTWKDTAYLLVLSVIGMTWGTIWLVLWGVALGSIVLPTWWWAMPSDAQYLGINVDTWQENVLAVVIGLVLIPISIYVQRGLALSQAHIARWLLEPSLAARVERLTETRAGAVNVAAAELQRIERDLHDGAQARLVALGDGPRHGRGALRPRPRERSRVGRRGARRGQAGARRAARPRPRHPPRRARGARPRGRRRRARRAEPGAGARDRRRPAPAARECRVRRLVRRL